MRSVTAQSRPFQIISRFIIESNSEHMKKLDSDLLIHVGLHKTGTTSVQDFLLSRQEKLLTKGILYPSTGLFYSQHALIPGCAIDNHLFIDHGELGIPWRSKDLNYFLDLLYQECLEHQPVITVLSSEVFCEIPSKEATQQLLSQLLNIFHHSKILICTRDHNSYPFRARDAPTAKCKCVHSTEGAETQT